MNKIILLLAFFASSAQAEEIDNRQVLNLTEPQRNHVLGEMRELLTGTQNILGALAKDDMAAVAKYSRALGFNMKHQAENPLHDVLPKEFMQIGMPMHKEFDQIAADAESLKDAKYTLKQLSTTMGKCTTCHSTYQIRPEKFEQVGEKANKTRLNEVAERGAHVMPFALEQTTHVFTKTKQGGVQQVIVKNKRNSEQIKLIRAHLSKISDEFTQGDFSNPAKIHGESMPGLAELRKAKHGQIEINYRVLADGAEVAYSAKSPNLIKAIHQWFDAQLSDHARHAVSGHAQHSMHHN